MSWLIIIHKPYPIDINSNQAVVYYNIDKHNLFRINDNVTLSDLKRQLNLHLNYDDINGWSMLSIIIH